MAERANSASETPDTPDEMLDDVSGRLEAYSGREECENTWCDVFPEVTDETPNRPLLSEWALVLASRGIPYRRRNHHLWVPDLDLKLARREIIQYERENHEGRAVSDHGPAFSNSNSSIFTILLLLVWYSIVVNGTQILGIPSQRFNALGSANAADILSGEWWRTITALTLHADPAHVLSNVAIGGIFLLCLCRRTGLGVGWLLVVCSGATGNVLNAWFKGPGHNAIGFSTAVFGAAGALAAIRAVQMLRASWRERMTAVAAGLGLLALLGFGEGPVDVTAHIFGFLTGLAFGGVWAAWEKHYGRAGFIDSLVAGFITIALFVGSWLLALAHGNLL